MIWLMVFAHEQWLTIDKGAGILVFVTVKPMLFFLFVQVLAVKLLMILVYLINNFF